MPGSPGWPDSARPHAISLSAEIPSRLSRTSVPRPRRKIASFSTTSREISRRRPRTSTRSSPGSSLLKNGCRCWACAAQVLSSRGEVSAAKGIIDYLIAAEGGPVHRVEDTPSGPILTAEPAPGQIWARYLASKTRSRDPSSPSDAADEPSADHLPAPFVPPDPIEFQRERGSGPMPFDPRPRRGFP